MASILYIILAILGIDFLILIHELGHYFMARRLNITVEEFAVGFGKPIIMWERKGVKWKIGMIPFGGYVRMAGMEKKGSLEPHQIQGGFFAQKPWNQIKVAAMGPIVNIVFAFIAFSALWMVGGRDKPFSERSQFIGWVNEESGPFKGGIRSGDKIVEINHNPFENFESFLYSAIYNKGPLQISGSEIDWLTGKKIPFTYIFEHSENQESISKAAHALSTLAPAQYLLYNKMPSGAPNKLLPGSPLEKSGIEYGDRIAWVDGTLIFSKKQLIETINDPMVLLTIERDGKRLITRVPRLQVSDLQMPHSVREELDDWRNEAKIQDPLSSLQYIPYNLDSNLTIESSFGYIDEQSQAKQFFEPKDRFSYEIALMASDKIVAVAGKSIQNSYELLKELQNRRSLVIVKKTDAPKPLNWKEANNDFEHSYDGEDLRKIIDSIGNETLVSKAGDYRLLNPITPIRYHEFPLPEEQSKTREEKLEKLRKQVTEISDPKRREEALKDLNLYQNRLMLGIVLQDRLVAYNPSPFFLIDDVFGQIVKTLSSLITGSLSPKYMVGPIGIVQVIQYGWSKGVKEALYFLGMISFNLGLLNLLPIPVLDGGHIVFAFWEMITKKPIPIKTREKLIFPFIILLIGVFIYFSFNDIVRIVTRFF